MRPWRVAVGLTMTGGALAVWALWLELAYVRPYWQVLLADYGWYIGAHGSLGLVTFGVGVYVAARSMSLSDQGAAESTREVSGKPATVQRSDGCVRCPGHRPIPRPSRFLAIVRPLRRRRSQPRMVLLSKSRYRKDRVFPQRIAGMAWYHLHSASFTPFDS